MILLGVMVLGIYLTLVGGILITVGGVLYICNDNHSVSPAACKPSALFLYGSCWIGSFSRKRIRDILKVPDKYNVDLVLALGYPWESPRCHDIKKGGSIKYEKDTLGVLHVPKRKLDDIIHLDYF
jgi:hypothetical protein